MTKLDIQLAMHSYGIETFLKMVLEAAKDARDEVEDFDNKSIYRNYEERISDLEVLLEE